MTAAATQPILLALALLGGGAPQSTPALVSGPNPQMQAVLDAMKSLGGKPIEDLLPAEARTQPTAADAVKAVLKAAGKPIEPEPVAKVDDLPIPGPAGPIPARIYTPTGTGPFPVLVYYHGGGWVLADLDTYDATPRALANAAGCIVVSSHYRQGPEDRFPAAPDDALAAYRWVVANAASFGGDPTRVAVGGESAGGNLAAVTAIRARDLGLPAPVHQLLVYPVTNAAYNTPSYAENAEARPLNKAMMEWFWQYYIAKPEDGLDPHASPLLDEKGGPLPTATVITADIDPLRDDGKLYAAKLATAGVKTEHRNFEGVTHEFFGMGAVLDSAKEAVAFAAERLKGSFAK